jgi:signal transduction histidine kinase
MAPLVPAALLCLIMAAALLHARHDLGLARRRLAVERESLRDLTRLVRLCAAELRDTAVSLRGQAQTAPEPMGGFLLNRQCGLQDLAERLLRQTDDPAETCRLQEEVVPLGAMLDFTLSRIAGQLGTGKRAWRVAPDLAELGVVADRRAMHQTLLRVLTSAALATGEGDWIEITAETAEDHWILSVQDEGAGLAVESVQGEGRETRGLGVGLALAHSLMQAHGGTLTLQSRAGIGTRARLTFPVERVVRRNVHAPPDGCGAAARATLPETCLSATGSS